MCSATSDPQQFVIILLVVIVCIQVLAEVLLFVFFVIQFKNAFYTNWGLRRQASTGEANRSGLDIDLINSQVA